MQFCISIFNFQLSQKKEKLTHFYSFIWSSDEAAVKRERAGWREGMNNVPVLQRSSIWLSQAENSEISVFFFFLLFRPMGIDCQIPHVHSSSLYN